MIDKAEKNLKDRINRFRMRNFENETSRNLEFARIEGILDYLWDIDVLNESKFKKYYKELLEAL